MFYRSKPVAEYFLNGRTIAVSGVQRLDQAVVAVSFPPKLDASSRELAEMVRVTVQAQALRRTGSAALNLCYLAAGRFDAYWGGNTKPWDVAPAALMIREAGGVITRLSRWAARFERCRKFVAAARRNCRSRCCGWWRASE